MIIDRDCSCMNSGDLTTTRALIAGINILWAILSVGSGSELHKFNSNNRLDTHLQTVGLGSAPVRHLMSAALASHYATEVALWFS